MHINLAILSYDHGTLRQVFDIIEHVVQNEEMDRYRGEFSRFADFALRFMDRYHHRKEEPFVFPLAAEGPDRLKEIMPGLIDDHRKARAFAEAIAKDVEDWDEEALRKNCLDLVVHMRRHILEEEEFVFPVMDSVMDSERDLELWGESEKFVAGTFGASFPSDMEAWANELQEKVWGKGLIKAPLK